MESIIKKQIVQMLQTELNDNEVDNIIHITTMYATKFESTVLTSFLTETFTQLSLNLTQKQQKYIYALTNEIVSLFCQSPLFYSTILSFFDSFSSFPENILSNLTHDTAFLLLIPCCSSKFANESINLLKRAILPKILEMKKFKTPECLCEYFLTLPIDENLKPEWLAHRLIATNPFAIKLPEIKEEDVKISEIVNEYPIEDVFSISQLEYLEKIYNSFSIGLFCVSVSLNTNLSNFSDDFFSNFISFAQKRTDLNQFIKEIDLPETEKLTETGFDSLFKLLFLICNKNKIDAKKFFVNWKNERSKFALMKYISITNNTMITMTCSNCWSSSDFILNLLEFSSTDENSVYNVFATSGVEHSADAILSLMKIGIVNENRFFRLLLKYFFETSQESATVDKMWSLNKQAMRFFSFVYAGCFTTPIRTVLSKTPKEYVLYLTEYEDFTFSFYVAVIASWNGSIKFSDYAKIIKKKGKLVDLVNSIDDILDNGSSGLIISDELLDDYYLFLSSIYEEIPRSVRSKIAASYKTARSKFQKLSDIDFSYKTKKATEAMRNEADSLLSPYLKNECTSKPFIDKIKKDKQISEYLIFVVVNEIKFLDAHPPEEITRICNLLIDMVKAKVLCDMPLSYVLSFVEKSLNGTDKLKFEFSCTFLDSFINFIDSHCFFASRLLQSNVLLTKKPELYKKLRTKINSFAFQEFIDTVEEMRPNKNVSKFFTMHPPQARTSRSITSMLQDNSKVITCIEKYKQYSSWLAKCIVEQCSEQPSRLDFFYNTILKVNMDEIVIQACSAFIHTIIKENDFVTSKGINLWIKASSVARLLGKLTLGRNKCMKADYLDFKYLIYYALSTGKLYGVVPIVCSFMTEASKLFELPNPYTSAMLQLLGSISVMKGIKNSIRIRIENLFSHFGAQLSDIAYFNDLFPDKVDNNFDFEVKPFSLQRMFMNSQIERLGSFDENLCFCFISSHAKIEACKHFKENIDSIKSKVIFAIYEVTKEGAKSIASKITPTIIEQLQIDSRSVQDEATLLHAAFRSCQFYSSAMVSQEVFFSFKRSFVYYLSAAFNKDFDEEWAQQTATLNKQWATSFIRDVAQSNAFHNCSEAIREMKLKTNKNVKDYYLAADVKLASQSILMQKDDVSDVVRIPVDEEFSHYLAKISTQCNTEVFRGYLTLSDVERNSYLVHLLLNPPKVDMNNVRRLVSVIRTFLGFFSNAISVSELFIESLAVAFERSIGKINNCNVYDVVAKMVRNFPLPAHCYALLIRCNAIDCETLDSAFVYILDRSPSFVPQFGEFIREFCYTYILSTEEFDIHQFMHTIFIMSFVTRTDNFPFDNSELNDAFVNLPLNVRPSNQNQTVQQDPLKDILNANDITATMTKWKNSLLTQNETTVTKAIKSCLKMPRDFFVVCFIRESEITMKKFIICLMSLFDIKQIHYSSIISALLSICQCQKYCREQKIKNMFKFILSIATKDSSLLTQAVDTLHALRPLVNPYFTFTWFDLASCPKFVAALASAHYSWPYLQLIIGDMCATVVMSKGMDIGHVDQPPVFQILYRALLRFLLILVHDFPDFMCNSSLMLCKFLPTDFVQARNIILSSSPKNMVVESPMKQDLKVDHIPDVHQICYPMQPALTSLPKSVAAAISKFVESKEQFCFNENDLLEIKKCIETSQVMCSNVIECCFELTFSPRQGSSPRLPFRQLPIYNILCYLLCNVNSVETAKHIIESLIDQLRFPSRNTHFFSKFIVDIYTCNLVTRDRSIFINDLIASLVLKRGECSPIPWGLEVVIDELLLNKELGFWDSHALLPQNPHSDNNIAYVRSILASIFESISPT